MLKLRLTSNLMIIGTVLGLFALSAMADAGAQTSQSLGSLHSSDLRTPPASYDGMQPGTPQVSSDTSLQPVQSGSVVYITGGIGDEERSTLKAVEKDYNLHITSAGKTGEYVGDTQVVITDRDGNRLVNAASGPLFYARLPAGTYTVEATSGGQTRKQQITVNSRKPSSLHFSWL